MDESRQSSLSGVAALLRKVAPPPALCGFLLLLSLIFTVPYAVGAAAGPVAPGMRDSGTSGSGAGGAEDTGDMGGMGGMGDMDEEGR